MMETFRMTNPGAHIDATDVYNSNDNLLDNAYFVGGGSQLGDGVFPINQRGQTQYTGGNGLDRWTVDGNVTVTLQSGNIRVQATAAYVGLYQAIPMSRLKNGETYTFSIILDGNMVTQTFVLNADGNWNNIYYGDDWYVPYVCANGICQFKVVNSTGSFDHTIEAVKLEKSTVSTLLNDVPPDFGEELRKCQRYLFVPTFPVYAWTGTSAYATGTANFNWAINTPVSMRQVIPTISVTGAIYVNNTAVSDLSIGNYPVGTTVIVSGRSANMTSGQIYGVTTSADSPTVIISCEP